ncbi:transcriptional regulator [Pseudoduganella buxea]|uniref:Transcriptional regulator n=1 Tax=Pseudoduganella buxea TaxID=1949069 RepID=A0ABQ1LA19_9BURK|nr:transcriptional regulator [Pseudoduganella buxea]
MLPTGQMHMVFRLGGPALRVFADADDAQGSTIATPVLGGVRTGFYVKEVAGHVVSVGVQLLPGAAQALFGVSAAELAERHTPLPELWGVSAESLLQQLAQEGDPRRQMVLLESFLAARLPATPVLHPRVVHALAACAQGARVDDMVTQSGYSHRGFIALFRHATGMSPKRYLRLLRFQSVLAAMRENPAASLSASALGAGYSDQAHMTREFTECAGITPSRYRQLAPVAAHHVAVAGAETSNFFKTGRLGHVTVATHVFISTTGRHHDP